jgi:hypothetical protein
MEQPDLDRIINAPAGDGITFYAPAGGGSPTPCEYMGIIDNLDLDRRVVTLKMNRTTGGTYIRNIN